MKRETAAWVVIVALVFTFAVQLPGSVAARDEDYDFVRTLIEVQRHVADNYVDDVEVDDLRTRAIEGMLGNLDPYTIYVPPHEQEAFDSALEGNFKGVGIQLNQREDDVIEVVTPIDGSPAFEAGVRAGDVLLKVDDTSVQDMKLDEAIKLIQGDLGTDVTLTVRHKTGQEESLTMQRQEITVPMIKGFRRKADGGWDYVIHENPKIAYVRLAQFTADTASQIEDVSRELVAQGVRGLVLDLRFNPGGRLDQAVRLVDLFVEDGVIVRTKGRSRPEQVQRATSQNTITQEDLMLVVLINEHSASASEVTAGSLKDNRRAVIIGTRSYGKGSVQEVIPLDAGELKMTVAYYYLPSGRLVHRKPGATDWGVEPDIIVAMDDEAQVSMLRERREADRITGTDPTTDPTTQPTSQMVDLQLQRAVESLVAMSLVSPPTYDEPILPELPTTTAPSTQPTTQPSE